MPLHEEFLTQLEQYAELAEQEKKIFVRLFGKDMSRQQIAQELFISESNVNSSLTGVYRKFNKSGHGAENRLRTHLTQRYLAWKGANFPSSQAAIAPSNIDNLVQEVRDRCCAYISAEYSKIQLVNRKQVDVSQLQVAVYVLEECSRDSRATIPGMLKDRDWYKDFDRLGLGARKERISELRIAEQEPKLIVFGKPGSGKSTFLKQIAIACCEGKILADYIPIFLELSSIKDATQFNLLDAIHQKLGLSAQEETKQILGYGKVLLLLDGLDEVTQTSRKVQECIYQFSKNIQYYKNRFILTCRTQTTEYIDCNFKCFEIGDFIPEQIKDFAFKWFQSEGLAEHFWMQLQSPENRQTAELAVTPILLSLICWVFGELGEFPSKRSKLYVEAIDLLLKTLDERKGIHRDTDSAIFQRMTLIEKKNLLSYIATRKLEQKQYVLFEQDEIQKYIADYLNISVEDAEEVLRAIELQHGLLVGRAKGIYSFSHLTFHEYFTARKIANSSDPQELEQALQKLASHITEERYREVFLLTVEMLPSADSLLRLMKSQTDAILEKDPDLQLFLTWLKEKAIAVTTSYKPAAVRAYYLYFDLSLYPYLFFHFDLNLVFGIDQNLAFDFNQNLAFDLDLDRVLIFNLDRVLAFNRALTHNFFPNFNRKSTRNLDLTYALTSAHKHNFNHGLQQELQKLQDQLPDISDNNQKNFKQWLQENCRAWMEQLRAVMIEHRSIGYNWRFTNTQEDLLQQYYDANIILINCLNSDCSVSPEVRQEIEETLLLPIAEIETWKKNRGKL